MMYLLVENGLTKKLINMSIFDVITGVPSTYMVNVDKQGVKYNVTAKRYFSNPVQDTKSYEIESIFNAEFCYEDEKKRYIDKAKANGIENPVIYDKDVMEAAFHNLCDSIFTEILKGMIKKEDNFVTVTFDINNLFADLIDYANETVFKDSGLRPYVNPEEDIERTLGSEPDDMVPEEIKYEDLEDEAMEFIDDFSE